MRLVVVERELRQELCTCHWLRAWESPQRVSSPLRNGSPRENRSSTPPKKAGGHRIPEIRKICLISIGRNSFEYGEVKDKAKIVSANSNFLDVFSVKIVKGRSNNLLKTKDDLLITEDFAEKVFGDENPIGKIIEFEKKEEILRRQVCAVIENPKDNSSLMKYDAILYFENGLP